MSSRLAIVTGLASEIQLIRKAFARAGKAPPPLACAGASAARARDLTMELIANGAGAIVSFGVCGGLDPARGAGDLILAREIVTDDGTRMETDSDLRGRLAAALARAGLGAATGTLLGTDRPLATARDKRDRHAATGAIAVDMESHGVLAAAAEAGVTAAVLRAVADPATRDLPEAARVATGPDGRVRPFVLMGALARRPGALPAMIGLALEARRGFAALRRIADPRAGLFGGD